MHDFLARLYHLGLHVLMIPGWRGPVAALVVAAAGAAFIGLADAVALLQIALVLVAAAAVVASDRGRLIPIDAAACTPLLVWFLAPRLLPRLNRAGPALAGALAAVAGVGIVWAAIYLFAQR
jgi:hypothetical protein